ncbi:cytochrome c peroxidase [Salmonella enterica subsp. enterica]|uniref:Cytochrome c peroxidase n=1 Tax=Salmonella enterica I TaxID=59201 RepID=A0A447N1D3_SALET|nr:cytochrome c peroxidase [Salmonella enterica subsp. enterica]
MKKITLYATTVITVGLLCYLGLSGYVWYYDKQRSKKSDVAGLGLWVKIIKYWVISGRKDVIIVIRLPLNCPFYSSFPVAKQLMDYDIQLGYKSFNLEAVRAALIADTPVPQSELNKIEWVMQHQTMPPTRYVALHWAGGRQR